jgi:hypothetical protein
MSRRAGRSRAAVLAAALLACLAAWGCAGLGAAGRTAWDKPGGGALELEVDRRDCAALPLPRPAALAAADQADACMRAKGWLRAAAAPDDAGAVSPGLEPVVSENGAVAILGRTAALPPGYVLAGSVLATDLGPAAARSLAFGGPADGSLELAGQRSSGDLGQEPYPVPEGAFPYDRGREPGLSWTVFCGRLGDGLYAGLGAYRTIDRRSRIVVAAAAPLPPAAAPAPPGLRLSADQRAAVERFAAAWLAWLRGAFADPGP